MTRNIDHAGSGACAGARARSLITSSTSSPPGGSPAATSSAAAPSSASSVRCSGRSSRPAAAVPRARLPRARRLVGRPRARPGAVIKAGIITPTGAINPVTVADQGGLDMLGQTGEYLCLSGQTLNLKPVLATSWSPNSTANVWTFKIRQGVKFHNGAPLTADDVVYTFQLHTNPKGRVDRAVRAARHRAQAVGRGEGRRLHGRLPPGGPERQLPVPGVLRQLQPDHPAEGLRPGQVGEHLHRHRAVRARARTRRSREPRSPATSRTGAPRRCRRRPSSPSTTRRTPRSWR